MSQPTSSKLFHESLGEEIQIELAITKVIIIFHIAIFVICKNENAFYSVVSLKSIFSLCFVCIIIFNALETLINRSFPAYQHYNNFMKYL